LALNSVLLRIKVVENVSNICMHSNSKVKKVKHCFKIRFKTKFEAMSCFSMGSYAETSTMPD